MNLARKARELVTDPATDSRKAAIRLAAELCTARARISALEAENAGQRQALQAIGLADDLRAAREAEREACARVCDDLGFSLGAQRIRERS